MRRHGRDQPSSIELARLLEPWFPLFGSVGAAALRDHLAAVPIMGLPRKTERANDLHRTMRTHLRRICDFADPLLSLVEEPEGDGLDYLVCRMNPDRPFAVRWGRYNGGTIRRNRTQRTRDMQEQGNLFGAEEAVENPDRLPTVTLGFTLEDDFTEVGRPCWWIGRLVLLRERQETSEFIAEVHVYSQPAQDADAGDGLPPVIVKARESEIAAWEQIIQQIRNSA